MHRGEPERLRPEEMMNDEDRSSSSSSSSSRTSATFATTAAAADVDMEDVPLPCLKWIILNATTNIELSNLSNVSQRWRFVVEQCIMDYAIRDDDNNDGDEKKNRNGNRKPSVSVSVSALPPFSLLLLPSMIRNYFLDQQQQQQQKHRRKEETVTRTEEGKGVAKEDDETYCLCWFHPDGIQSMQLELDQQHTITTATTTTTNNNNNNNNNNLIVMRRHKSHRHYRRCVVDVLYQWNGYSEAIDILKPFGYASLFVQNLINKIANRLDLVPTSNDNDVDDNNDDCCTTFAVRGATYARPEGYCNCWDDDDDDDDTAAAAAAAVTTTNNTAAMSTTKADDSIVQKNNDDGTTTNVSKLNKDPHWKRHLYQQRRYQLQREALPKVLWNGRIDDNTNTNNNGNTRNNGGARKPFIQFLNADSKNATRLFTPAFPKIETTPVTVFCVAIATEDGCFFSGLSHTFEMGHMYPDTINKGISEERSPICINAVYNNNNSSTVGAADNDGDDVYARVNVKDTTKNFFLAAKHSGNGDISQQQKSLTNHNLGDGFHNCQCPLKDVDVTLSNNNNITAKFQPTDDDDDDDDDDYDEETTTSTTEGNCDDIVRGELGPGSWHCYVAIFDGENSIIRIDGTEESLTMTCGDSDSDISDNDNNNHNISDNISSSFRRRACLDGVTIGSDHLFDMSLCFGDGSDGEGEGSMAELAIFKGRLPSIDIVAMEMLLMRKHGIPFPFQTKEERNIQDVYSRLAHTLMDNTPSSVSSHYSKKNARGVPLRHMTNQPNVAWALTNPVTGAPMAVNRIGNKSIQESSGEL